MGLLAVRTEFSFKRFEAVILGLYAILVGWTTYHHEPWADEAQAWLIARDSSLGDLFLKRLHYEGTPGLWHLLLWILCRLHVSYVGMHWVTAFIGVVSVYVLLRYSPFPALIRAALPFGFALVFQTAIVARSYSLVPLLAFLLCIVITSDRGRPFIFAVLAGLLANTAAYGLLLALGTVPLYWSRFHAKRKEASIGPMLAPGIVLAAFFVAAVYCAVPAPDTSFGIAPKLAEHPTLSRLLGKITAIPALPPSGEVLSSPAAAAPESWEGQLATRWNMASHLQRQSRPGRLFHTVFYTASLALFPVSSSNGMALLFYLALLIWQWRHHTLICLLPFLTVLLGSHFLTMSDHHTSILWSGLLVALWCGWKGSVPTLPCGLDLAFQVVLLAVLIEQIAWTGHAAVYDIGQPFDGSTAAARFILPEVGHHSLAGADFHLVSLQPYAAHNIFYNQSTAYWPWHRPANADDHLPEIVSQHPDFILDGETTTGSRSWVNQILSTTRQWSDLRTGIDKATYLRTHGYHEIQRFCGLQPAQFGFSAKTCEVVYVPVSLPRSDLAAIHH